MLLALAAALGCDGTDVSECTCPSAETSGAGTHFIDGEYAFYDMDGSDTLREGTLELDAKQARFTYRGPDGRMYRATYKKGPLLIDDQ